MLKTYSVIGSGLVRFSPDDVQAIWPIHEDSCCPKAFTVVLSNGEHYRLPPHYYPEVRGYIGVPS